MIRPTLTSLLLLPLLGACVTNTTRSIPASKPLVIAETVSEDGTTARYSVKASRRSGPSLSRVETSTTQIAFLGLNTQSIDRSLAESLSVDAWRGVHITTVRDESAAQASGLRVGDILLSLGGEKLSNQEQFVEVVRTVLQPGVPSPASRLRLDPDGGYFEEAFQITPLARKVVDSTTERIQLSAPDEIVERTGMQVATIEADIAQEAGLGDSSFAMVAGVVAGASAYEQGIRGGDRILECNGAAVQSAADVLAALKEGGSHVELLVDGPLGEHVAQVRTDEAVDSQRHFHIPILFGHSSRIGSTRTSFLDFIFQFGFNYHRKARASDTREPKEESYLSILPLGMFEFERTPEGNRTRIFWIITWWTNP